MRGRRELDRLLRVIISLTFLTSIKAMISLVPPRNCLIHLVFRSGQSYYDTFREKFLSLESQQLLLKVNSALIISSLELNSSNEESHKERQLSSRKGNSCVTFIVLSAESHYTKNLIGSHINQVQNDYFWFYAVAASFGAPLLEDTNWKDVQFNADPKLLLIELDQNSPDHEVKELKLFCQTCKSRVTPIYPFPSSSLYLRFPNLLKLKRFPSQTDLLSVHSHLRKSSLHETPLQIQYIPQPDSELESCLDESQSDIYFRDTSSCTDIQAILSVIMRRQLNMTTLEKTDFEPINNNERKAANKNGPQVCFSCSPYDDVIAGTSVITEDIGFRSGFYCTYTSETQKPSFTFFYSMISPPVMACSMLIQIAIAVIHKNPAFIFETSYIFLMQRAQRKWRRDFYIYFAPWLILLSYAYQASMTTEVVVPLKDKVVESMPALLKAGYRFALGNEEIVEYLAFNFGHIFLKWNLDLSTDLFIIDEDFKLGPQLLLLLAKHRSLSSMSSESPFVKYLRRQKSYDQSHSEIKCHCVEKDEHFGTQLIFFKGGLSDEILKMYISFHELGIHQFWQSTVLLGETAALVPGLLATTSPPNSKLLLLSNRNLNFQRLKLNSNLIIIFWIYIAWMSAAVVILILQIGLVKIKKLCSSR